MRQRQDNVLDVRYEFLIDGGLKSRQNSGQDKKTKTRQDTVPKTVFVFCLLSYLCRSERGDMAGITELLVALNTKEAAVSTADLARELGGRITLHLGLRP